MNKSLIKLLSLMLLLSLGVTTALADIHPSQRGDQGGANASKIEESIRNGTIPPANNAPTNNQPVPDPVGQPGAQGSGNTSTSGSGNSGSSSGSSSSSGTQALDWFSGGQALISKNPSITIYDVNTGITWGAKYINGKNHADIIPASAGDAQKITAGGITGSYVRRPVIVTIAGTKYAGSMYAVGHGETSYCDYYKGVMCIHFTGSKTHGSNKVDSDHQGAIQAALGSGN